MLHTEPECEGGDCVAFIKQCEGFSACPNGEGSVVEKEKHPKIDHSRRKNK